MPRPPPPKRRVLMSQSLLAEPRAVNAAVPSPASVAASARSTVGQLPRQRWVLTPVQDGLFIIAAPLLSLAFALAAFALLPAERAATLVLVTHVVLTVAHHMPTYIRLYGDLDTFGAARWRYLLSPLMPFSIALGVLVYLHGKGWGFEQFFFLFIVLSIWDPYHFLMQHYGFVRIYDRGNAAPQALAAGMDRWLCVAWMVWLLLASSAWLPDLLDDIDTQLGWSLLAHVPVDAIRALTMLAGAVAGGMSLVYIGYLLYCRRQGWFVSPAKIALLVLTFGAMYLCYTPNAAIRALAPGWSFKVGFATVGIVHMTQYLAIVWRYNRTLVSRDRAHTRSGLFRWLHSRGTGWAAGAYVLFCLAYGETLTTGFSSDWITMPILALGFTSTLMHYYYDGFIWKLRQPQTAANLSLAEAPVAETAGTPNKTAAREWLKPLLIFGIPFGLLTAIAAHAWTAPQPAYSDSLRNAVQAAQAGDAEAAQREARRALATMDRELPRARQLAALAPSSANSAQLALLLFSHSYCQFGLLPQLAARTQTTEQLALQRDGITEALRLMDLAVAQGGSLAHHGHEDLTLDDALRLRESWAHQARQLDAVLAARG